MTWRRLAAMALAFVSAVGFFPTTAALAADPHEVYERRCSRCHAPHARDFVRDNLERRDGKIIGRESGEEMRLYMADGHGRLKGAEIPMMVDHLAFIFESGDLFHTHCRICHDRAVILARRELIIRSSRLMGRYTGRDMADFLTGHGRLETDEVAVIMEMLRRQLASRE